MEQAPALIDKFPLLGSGHCAATFPYLLCPLSVSRSPSLSRPPSLPPSLQGVSAGDSLGESLTAMAIYRANSTGEWQRVPPPYSTHT